jgi:hypothetical protein
MPNLCIAAQSVSISNPQGRDLPRTVLGKAAGAMATASKYAKAFASD